MKILINSEQLGLRCEKCGTAENLVVHVHDFPMGVFYRIWCECSSANDQVYGFKDLSMAAKYWIIQNMSLRGEFQNLKKRMDNSFNLIQEEITNPEKAVTACALLAAIKGPCLNFDLEQCKKCGLNKLIK